MIVNPQPRFFQFGRTTRMMPMLMLFLLATSACGFSVGSLRSVMGEGRPTESEPPEEIEERLACSTDRRTCVGRSARSGQTRTARFPKKLLMSRTLPLDHFTVGHRLACETLAPLRC